MNILDRYVLKKHVGPFLFAVTTITFIFVMRVLVDFLDLFATRDLGLLTILEMFALSLGWIFALTFPMAVLVAVVMTFGRLAQDSELDAMHGEAFEAYERAVDAHIKNIRRKLEPVPQQPRYLLTVFGVGYRLAEDHELRT